MALKQFLFVTPLTPTDLLTPERTKLFQHYLYCLNQQTYANWQALIIGEEDKVEGKTTYLKSSAVTKRDKLLAAYSYISALVEKPDYLIRIDDDDIISPTILERIHEKEYDCYADKFHSFYDIASGMTSQQKRPWLANSIIHKMEHALTKYGEESLPLFTQDHSKAWHMYYANKKVKWARKRHPIYLRTISYTSISSGSVNQDSIKYKEYLKSFGNWKNKTIKDFSEVLDSIQK